MKIKRIDLDRGQQVEFSYGNGDRHIYITEGKHHLLEFGRPVKIPVGGRITIAAEVPMQVSCMYEAVGH